MEAMLITRISEEEWIDESLFDTDFPPLLNVSRPKHFTF
jgi:hypothetical protein